MCDGQQRRRKGAGKEPQNEKERHKMNIGKKSKRCERKRRKGAVRMKRNK